MDVQLQDFKELDAGFAQFVQRHGYVAGTPEVRHAYRRWEYDQILNKLEEERIAARQAAELAEGIAEGIAEGKAEGIAEGKAEGIAEGRAEGIAEQQMVTAINYLKLFGLTKSQATQDAEMLSLGIPGDIIKAARTKHEEM